MLNMQKYQDQGAKIMGDFRKILEDIEKLKTKYESEISLFISDKLIEFAQEFGELPNSINISSTRIDQVGMKSPYCLNIKTNIDIGL